MPRQSLLIVQSVQSTHLLAAKESERIQIFATWTPAVPAQLQRGSESKLQ